MKERVLAVLGAIALVAAAFVARSIIAGDDVSGGGDGGGGGEEPVVACTPDLMAVCDALVADGQIAADPPELDLDGAGEPDRAIDGWITWDPAPRIANFDAEAMGRTPVWDEAQGLGSDQLAVLVRGTQVEALRDSCTGLATWACLAGSADVTSVGVGEATSAEGLSRIAPLAKALDPDDVNEVDAAGLRALIEGPQSQEATAEQTNLLVTRGPGFVGAVVGSQQVLEAATRTEQGANSMVIEVSPVAPVTVVLAARTGVDLGDLAEQISTDASAQALARLGLAAEAGDLASEDLAGFLYQVRLKVG